ncbi:helix-turn-helix domain-containing protein [Acinetobacter sp. TSRC1-2]|uniref:helix-turn-helix domain-containing protein n=1 Tax=unclassified Acinetobacter TaxID=196816 RepID=UPI003CF70E0E
MTSFNSESSKFHEILREKRNALNLTQNELAQALGISNVMIQRYEMDLSKKNSARPSPSTMKKIEDFFSETTKCSDKRPLQDISLDILLAEIKERGFNIQLSSI